MSEEAAAPLLGSRRQTGDNARPSSKSSKKSARSVQSSESTPLLSREDEQPQYGGDQTNERPRSPAEGSERSFNGSTKSGKEKKRRWPSLIALLVLFIVIIVVLVLGFFGPAAIEEYANEAAVFEPTKLSIDSFTPSGVRARIQAELGLDASRVKNGAVRTLGRTATWIAGKVEIGESKVKVSLPEYDNTLLGTATIPPMVFGIRNQHVNQIDFKSDVEPGNADGIRRIANDWLEGRLGQLRIKGEADVPLRSGLLSLGSQGISEYLVFEGQSLYSPLSSSSAGIEYGTNRLHYSGHDLPAFPKFNITRLNFLEINNPNEERKMAVAASVVVVNEYPVQFQVPPIGFQVLVPNCAPDDPYILLADATTELFDINPRQDVEVNVEGSVRHLPDTLTTACPNSHSSPLDSLLGGYMRGEKTTLFIRGTSSPSPETPDWVSELLSSVTVPLPFPGHTFDNLIRNFSLADVHFRLPDPTATPGTPEAQPRLSANVKVLVSLPEEMNFDIDIPKVRADAEVFYHGSKLGRLDLKRWQMAKSSRTRNDTTENSTLLVESKVEDAPLEITDNDVFSEVVRALVFGKSGAALGVTANVDVEAGTALGKFIIKDLPADGKILIKPISRSIGSFAPSIGGLKIEDTDRTSFTLRALLNFTNPTEYSATVPYIDINILSNGTILGHATAKDIAVHPGKNINVAVEAVWDPNSSSGERGQSAGRELLSQYISGWNTSITLQMHSGSVPSQPALGQALSSFAVDMPTPHLTPANPPDDGDGGGDDDDDGGKDRSGPHFIQAATMHLLSSTANFILLSPLPTSTLYLTHINATALYNHTQPVGVIHYEVPFAVPPGSSETPALPVEWSTRGVGYDIIKKALGGQLKLDARAEVGIRIDKFVQDIWFEGGGIGAKIRI